MKLARFIVQNILHGLADFPSAPISTRDNPFDLRSLNPHTLSGFTAKTSSFKCPDDLELWNSLPSDVALANYDSFKCSLSYMF